MIYDDRFFEIEDQVSAVVHALAVSPSFEKYLQAKKQVYNDQKAVLLKQVFNEKKRSFEKIADYGTYAPGYKEQQREVRKAKRALDLNEKVAEFRLAETDLQNLLDEIGLTVAQTISSEIKVDAGNPFFVTGKHSGCGGNCHAS